MPGLDANALSIYRRLLRYLRPYWLILAAAIVPAAIYAVVGTAVPLLMTEVVERLQDVARTAESAWQIPVAIAVLFPIRSGMDFLAIYGLAWVGRSIIRDLRNEVFAHYLTLPAAYYDQ